MLNPESVIASSQQKFIIFIQLKLRILFFSSIMSVGSKPWSPGVLHGINIDCDSIAVEIMDVCFLTHCSF